VLVLAAAAGLLSGCAGTRARQELARLQSQVGLLEERVTQLERTAPAGPFTGAALPAEPSLEIGTTTFGGGALSPAPAKKKSAGGSATLKPTTREIQQALKNAGFYQGNVDGKSGPMTREAIKEFQRVHGLTDDGVVGKQTWAKLKTYADLSGDSGELNAAEVLK
jgi:peptidoglycan hydrolase-like protein with peptidoglycan-binding domain